MSLQLKPNQEKDPEEQIKSTLSQLDRIGSIIVTDDFAQDEDNTDFLEKVYFNGKTLNPSELCVDEDLSSLVEEIQNANRTSNMFETTDTACNVDQPCQSSLFDVKLDKESPFLSNSHLNKYSDMKTEYNKSTDFGFDDKDAFMKASGHQAIDPEQVDIYVEGQTPDGTESTTKEQYVYGGEALLHYKLFKKLEEKKREEEMESKRQKKIQQLKWQLEMLDRIVTIGREFFHNPKGKAAKRWHDLQEDVSEKCSKQLELQNQLGSLPVYFPYFTSFIIIVQLVTFIVICAMGKVTTVGFEPQYELQKNMKTFLGMETVHRLVIPNPWIGPSGSKFIEFGAMYAPCMREDFELNIQIVKQNYSHKEPLGCCEVYSRNTAGTTTEKECQKLTNGGGVWRGDSVCSQRVSGNNSVEHNMKPCCVGTQGNCRLISHHHCLFLQGIYHVSDNEHCSQVNCLSQVCGMGGLDIMKERPWLAIAPNQWWRALLSLIYNQGILQLLLVCTGHLFLTRVIESIAGWLRVAFIYILAGFCGTIAGAIFSPYEAHFGTIGSLFGMVGVTVVEFLQSWKLVKKPYRELVKLLAIILASFLCGTLPFVSNFQLVFSLITGMMAAIIILPYVTFGRWERRCRKILVGFTVPVLLLLVFILMYVFYRVQTLTHCKSCQNFECIPYTSQFCFTG